MEKMNFNRWALAITAVPTTLTSRFPTTGYARLLLFIMYKARARRNGYRMLISVYILCNSDIIRDKLMKFRQIVCWMSWKHYRSKKEGNDQESINKAPHLTQDTNGKVTTSQLDITNESQEVSPFPAGDQKASTNRRA